MCAVDGLHCAMKTVPLEEVTCYFVHWALEVSAEAASIFIAIWHTVQ
jgi:hypothetical protein